MATVSLTLTLASLVGRAMPHYSDNGRKPIRAGACEKQHRGAELAVADLCTGKYPEGQGGIEQRRSQCGRNKSVRAVDRGARYELAAQMTQMTQMTQDQHDNQQSKVREDIEQEIGHFDGMKAQRLLALPKRLLTQSRSVVR